MSDFHRQTQMALQQPSQLSARPKEAINRVFLAGEIGLRGKINTVLRAHPCAPGIGLAGITEHPVPGREDRGHVVQTHLFPGTLGLGNPDALPRALGVRWPLEGHTDTAYSSDLQEAGLGRRAPHITASGALAAVTMPSSSPPSRRPGWQSGLSLRKCPAPGMPFNGLLGLAAQRPDGPCQVPSLRPRLGAWGPASAASTPSLLCSSWWGEALLMPVLETRRGSLAV